MSKPIPFPFYLITPWGPQECRADTEKIPCFPIFVMNVRRGGELVPRGIAGTGTERKRERRKIEAAQRMKAKGWNEGNAISRRKRADRRNEGKWRKQVPRNFRGDVVPKMKSFALLKRAGSGGWGGWALNSSKRSESWPKVDFLFSSFA